jgi:hypothetical protein
VFLLCEREITLEEEARALSEKQPKCDLCREDGLRVIEHIRRRGGFKEVFGDDLPTA